MRGGAFLKGKEGRVGFRKKVFPCRRDGEVEKKPLSTRKDGMIIRCICHHHKGCNQTKDGETTTQIYLNSIKSSEVDGANAKILAAL